jgi:hypothetical protein
MLEKRTFNFGVDADSALSGVENGFVKWMRNCVLEDGVNISNIRGNLRVDFEDGFTFFDDNPDFSYKCLGYTFDAIKNKGYYFVWASDNPTNALGWSFIFEYDVVANIINVVCDEIWSDYLLFEEDELITGISVIHIDEFRPLLYWTQRAGLRKINIYKAKETYAATGGYTDLDIQIVDRIKYPPRFAPEIRQITDTGYIGNNIQKGFFQFSYAHIYDDYERSVPSDWSRVNIPFIPYASVSNDISLFQESQRNNLIQITLKKPFITVSKIEILVREKTSNVGTEVNFDWRVYDVLNVSDITWDINDEYVYKFYNDKVGQLVTQEFANRVFDNVPLKAVADTYAEDSRMYNGNITEGFDLEPIDADVSFTEHDYIATANEGSSDLYVYQIEGGFIRGTIQLPALSTGFEVGGMIEFQYKAVAGSYPGNYNYQYIIKEGDLDTYPNSLVTAIQANYTLYNANDEIDFVFGSTAFIFYLQNDFPVTNPTPPDNDQIISAYYYPNKQNCLPQFKNRHAHYFGIGYGDNGGRRSSVQKLDRYYHSSDLEKVLKGRIEINHVPPIWATQYYIYYSGFDAGNLYQIKVLSVGRSTSSGNITVRTDFFQTAYRYADSTFLKYSYSAGDRIKFLYGNVDGELNNSIDVAVLSAGENENEIVIEGTFEIDLLVRNSNFLCEIYKKSIETDLYYTIGKNDIGDAGLATRYHKGNTQDQTFSPDVPAIQDFDGVNMYLRPRYYTYSSGTNLYSFFNINTDIDARRTAGQTYFFFEMNIYDDLAMTNQVNYCAFNVFLPVLFTITPDPSPELICAQFNNPLNWNSTDDSFSDRFFISNFTLSFNSSGGIYEVVQHTDYPDILYFRIAVSDQPPTATDDDIASQSVITTAVIDVKNIEDPNQSDLFVGATTGDGSSTSGSAVTSYGKPNIVNNNFRQVTRENTIWYSQQLIPESNINGLSSYPDGQFKDYQNWGSIQKLYSSDRDLKVFMELRVGWIPIRQYLTGGDNANLVLNNADILTTMNYYQEKRGVGLHPESHVNRAGKDYFADPITNSICRISRDGLTVLSDAKNAQGNYVIRQTLYNQMVGYEGNFVAGYNPRRDSYEVNINGVVFVWNEEKNQWHGGRSYDAENFGNTVNDLVSFSNGRLYLHEANEKFGIFYGEYFVSEVWVVGNAGTGNKIYKSIRTKSTTANAAEISNDRGQYSMLVEGNFEEREGVWYSELRRDMNTKNVLNPIIEGNAIRDLAILIKLQNSSMEKEVMLYCEINQIDSK